MSECFFAIILLASTGKNFSHLALLRRKNCLTSDLAEELLSLRPIVGIVNFIFSVDELSPRRHLLLGISSKVGGKEPENEDLFPTLRGKEAHHTTKSVYKKQSFRDGPEQAWRP
jgi:hypothetical protein